MARATALAVVTFTWALTALLGVASADDSPGASGCAAFPDTTNEVETDTSYLQLDRTQRTKEKGQRRNIAIAQEMAESLKNQIGETSYRNLTAETVKTLNQLDDIITNNILPAIAEDAHECQNLIGHRYRYLQECNTHLHTIYGGCKTMWSGYQSSNESMVQAQADDDECRKKYQDYEKLCDGLHQEEESTRLAQWYYPAHLVVANCVFDKNSKCEGAAGCAAFQTLRNYVNELKTNCHERCVQHQSNYNELTQYQRYRDDQAQRCSGYRDKLEITYETNEKSYGEIEDRLCELGRALRRKCEAEAEFTHTAGEITQEGSDHNTEADRVAEWTAVKRIQGTIHCFKELGSLSDYNWQGCVDDYVNDPYNAYPSEYGCVIPSIAELVADIKCDQTSFELTGSDGQTRSIELDSTLTYFGLCNEYEEWETPAPTYRTTPPPTEEPYTPPPTWDASTTSYVFTTPPPSYTEGPTPYPTTYPTPEPTPYTTPYPTFGPDYEDPTPAPTYAPTATPPPSYTPPPTRPPTYGPTPKPTYTISPRPTYNTRGPTPRPTKYPSLQPTEAPRPTPKTYVKGKGYIDGPGTKTYAPQ